MRRENGTNGMDPDARYNDKGQAVSPKWRNNWPTGWCSLAHGANPCISYPKRCDECLLLNGKRTMYEGKGNP